jgi:hypothetical protein
MVSALQVLGLNILPAMVGSWWIDWARWVYTGVQGEKEREARRGLLQRMVGRGEGLEVKWAPLEVEPGVEVEEQMLGLVDGS